MNTFSLTFKVTKVIFLCLVLLFLWQGSEADAAFNQQINYQGKLTDNLGATVADGVYNIAFNLYDSTQTNIIWTSTTTATTTNGLFSYMLGSSSTLSGVDFNQTLYLSVNIGGIGAPSWDGEMTPRKILGAVPAAFEADNAQTLDNIATSSFVRSDQADTIAATTASTLLTITQSGSGDILNLFDDTNEVMTVIDGGNVGIGTTSPYAKLSVAGHVVGQYFTATSTATSTFPTLSVTGSFYDSAGTAGANGYVLQTDGTSVSWVATSSLNISSGSTITFGTNNQIPYMNGTTDFQYSSNFTFDGTTFTVNTNDLVVGSNLVGIGTSSPLTALDVYGNLALSGSSRYLNFGATSSDSIGSTGYGIRDNGGQLEFKNIGGGWDQFTTSTTGPSFYVHKNGTNQTISADSWVKLTWSHESFDTNNNFDLSTERFTPTVPGKYLLSLAAQCSGSTGCYVAIYKNGSNIAQSGGGSNLGYTATAIVEANGTTDYFEGYVYNTGGTTINGTFGRTIFSGAMIAPVSPTGGGWDDNGGYVTLTDNTDKVGIGTSTPYSKFTIQGSTQYNTNPLLSLADYAGTPGFELRLGTSSLNNLFMGYGSGDVNVSGTGNVTLGKQTLGSNTTGAENTAIGSYSLFSNIDGYSNNALGMYALNANTTGFENSAVGHSALYANTTGSNNVAVGGAALSANTTGSSNVAIGSSALITNVTGERNIAIGLQSSYYNYAATGTVAMGYRAAEGTSSGFNAQGYTSIGYLSGRSLQTGSDYNTFLGYQAGYDVTTGNNNTILGQFVTTGSGITTGSNNILIGQGVRSGLSQTGSNQLNVGNLLFGSGLSSDNTLSTGNIGVGTSSPYATFSVAGDIALTGGLYDSGASLGTNGFVLQTTGSGVEWVATSSLNIAGSGASLWTQSGSDIYFNTGNVGISTTSPLADLDIYGDLALSGASRYLNFGATSSDSIGSGGYGFRDNNGTIEFKNKNGTWQSVTTATSGPSFSASRASAQTLSAATYTKLNLDTEDFDTNNNFDLSTDRFTPTVPGKYIVTVKARFLNSGNSLVNIYKNGSIYKTTQLVTGDNTDDLSPEVTAIIDMNGTTDYVEAYGYHIAGGSVDSMNFAGIMVAPVSETGGGWDDNGGYVTLTDNTDFVGIGTSTPNYLLDIYGNLFVGSTTDGTLFVDTGSGRVGIGTTTPWTQQRFQVDGKIIAAQGLPNADATYGAGFSFAELGRDTGMFSLANNELGLYTGAVERLYIGSDGKVGIGTSSPFSLLTIAGDITPDVTLTYDLGSSTRRWDNLWAQTLNVGTSTWSIFNGSNGRFAISNAAEQGGTETFTILSSGNVGVGTANPNSILHVADDVPFITLQDTNGATTAATPYLKYTDSSNSILGFVGYLSTADSDLSIVNNQSADINFSTNNTQRMIISAAGSVGIGTTSPASLLDVYGNFQVGTSGAPLLFADTAANRLGIGTSSPADAMVNVFTDGNFPGGNAIKMETSADAHVGFSLTSNGGKQWQFSKRDSAGDDSFRFYHYNGTSWEAPAMTMMPTTGNIGVGTTSPTAKLTVYGNTLLEGSSRYLNFGTTEGTSGYGIRDNSGTLQFKDSGGAWTDLTVAGSGGARLTNIQVYTADDTWTKASNTDYIVVYVTGGGGGGGSGVSTDADSAAGGGGGGGGETRIGRIPASSLSATTSVTIGAGGGGATGGSNGSTGGSSAFGSSITATGGTGGVGINTTGYSGGRGGYNTAGGSGGDVTIVGGTGEGGLGVQGGTINRAAGGAGGSSHLGGGGLGTNETGGSADGGNGLGYGGGGGGGAEVNNAGNSTGGDGAGGIVIVYEYQQTDDTQKFTESGTTIYVATTSYEFVIGTTTGSSKLTVWAEGTNDILNLFETDGTEVFTVLESGNVGIGSSTPTKALSVTGDISVSGNIFDSDYSSGTVGYILQTTATGTRWVATSSLNIAGTSVSFGTDSQIPFMNGAGSDFQYEAAFSYNETTDTLTIGGMTIADALTTHTVNSTTTVPNNSAYAWTIATSTTATPLLRIDSTAGSEGIVFGAGGSDVVIGDTGSPSNLIFEENSTIKGQGSGKTITIGANSDIINFGVDVGFGSSSPHSKLTVASGDIGAFNGAICADNGGGSKCYASLTAGVVYGDSSSFTASDIAENYTVTDPSIEAGDIVAVALEVPEAVAESREKDREMLEEKYGDDIPEAFWGALESSLERATNTERVLGIISSEPGVLLGDITGLTFKTEIRPVALSGRVPVKVNMQNGPIVPGDELTLSSQPGVAMKARPTDTIIGIALGTHSTTSQTNTVLTFVNLEKNPMGKALAELTLNFDTIASSTYDWQGTTTSEALFAKGFFESIFAHITKWLADAANGIGKLFAGSVHTQQLCVGDSTGAETCLTKEQIDALISGAPVPKSTTTPSSSSGSSSGSNSGSGNTSGADTNSGGTDQSTTTEPTDTNASSSEPVTEPELEPNDTSSSTPTSDPGPTSEPPLEPEPVVETPTPEPTPEPEPEPVVEAPPPTPEPAPSPAPEPVTTETP